MFGVMLANRPKPILGYLTTEKDTATVGNEWTFSSVTLGDEPTGNLHRHIIVTITGDRGAAGRIPTAVTIGGVSATIHAVGDTDVSNNTQYAAIVSAIVDSGTTGDIVVTAAGDASNCAINVYRVIVTHTDITPTGTATDEDDSTLTGAVFVANYGVGVANEEVTSTSWTWTAATEDVDDAWTSEHTRTSATADGLGQQTITATPAAGGTQNSFAICAW